jgi:serine/threonine-protein kinase
MFKQIFNLLTNSDELIVNRYELKHLIGKGAMGKVYCASDQNLEGVNVAIKFLSQTILDEKIRARFKQEAQISALLGEKSIHIVKVKDYGLDKHNIPFYVMELLQGKSLDKIINSKVISLRKFLSLTRQICLGLECAHNGILIDGQLSQIIHRDIKPSNIFIVQDPAVGNLVKILDFGVAQIINYPQSESKSFMGTPKYSSPEQMGKRELDARSDIYSLGVMMYQMLTGKMPFKPENNDFRGWDYAHHKLKPEPLPRYLNLPHALEKMIISCLQKSPERRPQTVGEIVNLIHCLEQEYKGKDSTSNLFTSPKIEPNLLALQEKYRQSSWPADKPQQKIVFPKLTKSKEGVFASLWTMLEPEDILKVNLRSTFCYNHFLFQAYPHPMLVWINLLYSHKYEPKWLPCYLDLKTELGNKILRSLVKYNLYYILLFTINKPEKYQQIIKLEISHINAKEIKKILQISANWQGEKNPEASKKILKKQFEQVKVKILELIKKVNSK